MATIKVKGMSCMHCVMAVTKALEAVEGVEGVTVDLDSGRVTYRETSSVDMNVIRETVKNAGYEVI